jgi:hypothetical protein
MVATEGALWGSIKAHGFLPNTVIVSDDAGQFNVGQHGLCWVHYLEHIFMWSGCVLTGFGQNRFAVAAAWQSLVPTHHSAFLRGPIATSWRRCLLQRCHVAKEPPP